MTLPKVSIVIPSYKPGHFEACLRSAIGQSYPNIEILVSDNCPTEAIREICEKFPQVIYQRCSAMLHENIVSALFSGKGTYIKPLFDDDILHPFCVERMVAVLQTRQDVELVFSASEIIDADNMRVETRRPYATNGSLSGRDLQRRMILEQRNFVGEFSTVMFRRAKIWQLGWRELFIVGEQDFTRGLTDMAAYFNLTKEANAFYIDEELSYFRRDPRLQSNSNPAANPDYGYCISEHIDLLLASHATGLVSDAEIVAMKEKVENFHRGIGAGFAQVQRSYDCYIARIENLK